MSPIDTNAVRLLIVDDHQITRMGLRTLLSGRPQFDIVGEAGSVTEALEAVTRLHPDLILLDLRLSDGSGLEICRRAQALHPSTKVLVLTAHADDEMLFGAIAAGANGYLIKDIHAERLIRAIQDVSAGKSVLDPAVTRRVMTRALETHLPATPNKLGSLSVQERRVIALVAEGKTNKEIGRAMGLSAKTVKNYLSNAMEKLGLHRRSQAAALFITQSSN